MAALALAVLLAGCADPITPPPPERTPTPEPTASPTPLPTLPGQAYGVAVCPAEEACPVFASPRDAEAGIVAGYLADGQVVGVTEVQRVGTLVLCRLDADGGRWTACARLEPCDWVDGECTPYAVSE